MRMLAVFTSFEEEIFRHMHSTLRGRERTPVQEHEAVRRRVQRGAVLRAGRAPRAVAADNRPQVQVALAHLAVRVLRVGEHARLVHCACNPSEQNGSVS